jgi:hypothetical protein
VGRTGRSAPGARARCVRRVRGRTAQAPHGEWAPATSGSRTPRPGVGRCLLMAGAVVVAACASNLPPPGGPERHAPPIVLSFTPETNAVDVRVHQATIQFDEVVSERPQGSPDLNGMFLISPWDGPPNVGWHRTSITIRPRHGFRPNTVYTITMLPGIVDLHNNVRRNGASLTFSTGSTIPATIARGRIFDWLTGQVAPRAFVQAFAPTDTLIVYVAEADSAGRFLLPHLAPGPYVVRGFIDANHNRKLDRTELWDTAHINLIDSARVEILAFLHDTIGPRVTEVAVRDSVTLRVTFDHGLDTALRITPEVFGVKDRDSTAIPIAGARSAAAFDSAADSAARWRSDSAFRSDSIRQARAGRPVSDTAAARRREARAAARRDSIARLRRPTPSRPSPIHEVVLQLGVPLRPGIYYRLRAIDIPGLLGKTRSSDRVFSMPKPEKVDSLHPHTRADSASRRRRAPVGGASPPGGATSPPAPAAPPSPPPSNPAPGASTPAPPPTSPPPGAR